MSRAKPKIVKIQNFAEKVLNIGISPVFNDISNTPVNFSSIRSCIFFFSKWRLLVKKGFLRCNNPPSTPNFDGLPYPHLRWYPHFSPIKVCAKDVK